jgi:hypothetical protein
MSYFSASLVAQRLGEQRRAQRDLPFLAPLLRGGRAHLRIAGLIQQVLAVIAPGAGRADA